MTDSARTASRWYREPMMWLVAGIPAVMVTASLVLVAISVHVGADEALPVDVRRTAQIQVEDLRADRAAIALGMRGTLSIDPATGAIDVGIDPLPESAVRLRLALIHPSRAAQDRHLTLTRSGERFLGRVPLPLPAVWTVLVSADDGAWRIAGRFEAGRAAIALAPQFSEGH